MRTTLLAGVMLLAVPVGVRAANAPCDRACLNGLVDQYPAAPVAYHPSRLPLTKNALCTENGQTLKLGDGMWDPVIAMGTRKLYFADPGAGQAGFYGTLEEHGQVTSSDPNGKNSITRMSCGEHLATGFSKVITKVEDRRFPIVDEERNLASAVVPFDHNGRNKITVWNDGSTHPVSTPFDEAFSFEIGEPFTITHRKIQQTEALVLNVPYGMPTGWGRKE